ncbi:hypothetical protein NKH53_31625 [Mesorhizobium australicum]|uniref:hypothetical protein n=1 Tax=Mesorhizobium australicum TaxID=536018 RepID=UPI0033382CC5
MTALLPRSLGILSLDQGQEFEDTYASGSTVSTNLPVISELVEGALVERVVRGDMALEPAYVTAAKRLVERGAVAISSDCGFAVRYQKAVASSVNVPVAMSSLLLLPTLISQSPPSTKIGVVTYDSTCFSESLLGLNDSAERDRVVVGGIEGSKYWHDQKKHPAPPDDVEVLEGDISASIMRMRAAHPEIAYILFECTGFPLVAPAVRRSTQLPVYDIVVLRRMLISSVG